MKILFYSFLKLLFYGLLLFGSSSIIELDFINGSSNENDFIELAQHSILIITILTGFIAAAIFKTHRILMVLLSLFILIHLEREFDAWFDVHLPEIGWFPTVIVTLFLAIFILLKNKSIFSNQIKSVYNTLGFGILLIALAFLHVFTRVYGKPSNWKSIMGDNYLYQVERISEESVELVAYTMILIAFLELFFFIKKESVKQ